MATAESKGQDVGTSVGAALGHTLPHNAQPPPGKRNSQPHILTKSQDHYEEGRKGKSRTFLFGYGNTQSLMQRPHVTRVWCVCVCGVCVCGGVCVCVWGVCVCKTA